MLIRPFSGREPRIDRRNRLRQIGDAVDHHVGIAQLGALQMWANSKRDKAKALNSYKKSLTLGGSRPLPELFSAAGCKFQFDAATIKPLIQLANSELKKL